MNKLKKQLLILSLALNSTLVGCGVSKEPTGTGITAEIDRVDDFGNTEETYDPTPASIPSTYYNKDINETTTIGDLNSLHSLEILPSDSSSIFWLSNCKNLRSIDIDLSKCSYDEWNQICYDLEKIDFSGFEKLETAYIYTYLDGSANTFNEENFGFLRRIPNLKNITIITNWIDSSFIETFNNLEELQIYSSCANLNIDYSKLPNLKRLDLSGYEPYTLAMDLTNSDLETLDNNGVEVVFRDNNTRSKLLEINNKLDLMIDDIDIKSDDTDIEKLRKISIYITDNLEYDKDTAMAIGDGEDVGGDYFYQDGFLYGALEEKSQVCGNYSALLHALGKRVGLEVYDVSSINHAWNFVKLNDDYYVVDLTYIDYDKSAIELLKNNQIDNLAYYLKTLDQEKETDLNHLTVDVPEEVIKKNKVYEKKYKTIINNEN